MIAAGEALSLNALITPTEGGIASRVSPRHPVATSRSLRLTQDRDSRNTRRPLKRWSWCLKALARSRSAGRRSSRHRGLWCGCRPTSLTRSRRLRRHVCCWSCCENRSANERHLKPRPTHKRTNSRFWHPGSVRKRERLPTARTSEVLAAAVAAQRYLCRGRRRPDTDAWWTGSTGARSYSDKRHSPLRRCLRATHSVSITSVRRTRNRAPSA